MNLKEYLHNPLKVGNQTIENRLVLAPMAVLGNMAFREMVERYGGFGLLFMEMCNANSVPHENRHVSLTFRWRDEERRHLVCQLLGGVPEVMARAAQRIEKEGFFGVDINFGCSVAAICKKNYGAALLKDPGLAESIVAAVRQAVSIPVFAKFRTGWSPDPGPAVELAKRFEAAGADALTFHPRVAPDRRGRAPQWEHIRLVKNAVSIPVFGNGNVFDETSCASMIEQTGCDGVAIGRMAVVKPWIFASISQGFSPEPECYEQHLRHYVDCLEQHYDPRTVVKLFKKNAIYYAANFTFGHLIWSRLIQAETPDDIRKNISDLFATHPQIASSPNMNLMI